MEEKPPLVFGDLNKGICQECGLPMKVHSFTSINQNTDEEKIIVKLFCQNLEHKTINDFNFEDYLLLMRHYLDKTCQCILCKKILQDTNEIPYYCYSCKQIICSECLKQHEKEHADHKDVFKYEDLQNKCLIHNDSKNELNFYCVICKINLCANCLTDNLDHFKEHNVKKLNELKDDESLKNKINDIQKEHENYTKQKLILLKQLEIIENKINFTDFLLKEQTNYFHLFYDNINFINNKNINQINNNKINNNEIDNIDNNKNNINNNSINKNMNNNYKIAINAIYLDENIKFEGMDIVNDCNALQNGIKGTVILTNNLENLELLLKTISKNNAKSKFVLIVNGSSADNTIKFLKKNKLHSMFLKACIYTKNIKKYSKIKEYYSDFIEKICIDCKSVLKFIKETSEKYKDENEQYYINTIINWISYHEQFYPLHSFLSIYYGDESEKSFSLNYSVIEGLIKEKDFSNEAKEGLLRSLQDFSELKNKNYEKIIISYLKDDNLAKVLNSFLMEKNPVIYQKVAYFAGNLMYCLVEYGKKAQKGINSTNIFYRGLQLNIIEVLEFLKNRNYKITFPYFVSLVDKKELVEISSKRNMSDKDRKAKGFYSVIMKISYLHEGFEPSIFNIKDLSPYPDEEDYILLPFTFLKVNKINIDSDKYIADIELEVVGKNEILEYKIREMKELEYDKKDNIIFAK